MTLLEARCDGVKNLSDAQYLRLRIQVKMLERKLIEFGFSPTVEGCKSLVDCIPQPVRKYYSNEPVEAAIEYLSKET